MASLPKKLDWSIAQDRWASILNPVVENPANNSNLLKGIALLSGTNVINHRLGRTLQGWNVVRKRAAADIYDKQDSNQTPDLTLVLVSSANVVVDLGVF